jgi:outer membrane receptor for Fe3+-dicitrate
VANLYAEFWTRGHRLAASLRISNLFDNHYYNAGNGTARTYFRAPQDTRSVQAGLRLRF